MTLWRYKAIPINGRDEVTGGEVPGATAVDARATLRRVGLQALELRAVRSPRTRASMTRGSTSGLRSAIVETCRRHLRQRRRLERAEFVDGLATLLDSGLPVVDAVGTLLTAARRGRSATRAMLAGMHELLRGGSPFDDAAKAHPGWFDPVEVAMLGAAQQAGSLPQVLRSMGVRHEQSGRVSQKLASALAYPTLLSIVGLVVVVFLSVKTLPQLVGILDAAGVQAPPLTLSVMSLGQWLARWALIIVACVAVIIAAMLVARTMHASLAPAWSARLIPRFLRRLAVAQTSIRLAELMRSGVPAVESLRVLAPTCAHARLQLLLKHAAHRLERGEDLSQALDDDLWFDAEFRRLLDIGTSSGELEGLLVRIGDRYERSALRLIDRLTSLLEPAVILLLAVLVGTVVMAAVLPLLRLQEIV